MAEPKAKKKKSVVESSEGTLMMVSSSLAVRYRPQLLRDLIGQQHIVDQARGILRTKKIPGTILLSGTTGAGKTTTARIFSRYINCATFNACGICPSCKLTVEDHPDYTEINTAETGGKDDAKKLIGDAKYMPRFNVRIIMLDEFHNCVTGDTEVLTTTGKYTTIQEIVDNKLNLYIPTYNFETGVLEQQEIVNHFKHEVDSADMVEVHLEDGGMQPCTKDHEWWSLTRNAWVTAENLLPGEELLCPD